jgi:hypothetical protein
MHVGLDDLSAHKAWKDRMLVGRPFSARARTQAGAVLSQFIHMSVNLLTAGSTLWLRLIANCLRLAFT